MATSDFTPEVSVSCMRNEKKCNKIAVIIGTVRSLWTWLWGRYHVPQNVFLAKAIFVIRPTVFVLLCVFSTSLSFLCIRNQFFAVRIVLKSY